MVNIHRINARDLPDLWFQVVHDVLDHGRRFVVDQGSFAGQTRLEFDYFIGHIRFPGTKPLLPDIPPHIGIPNPIDEAYLNGGESHGRAYIEYLMSPAKEDGEAYTYGNRLTQAPINIYLRVGHPELLDFRTLESNGIWDDKMARIYIDQVQWIIETYRDRGHRNNQMILQVAQPSDIELKDPPCLRHIDTRIQDGALHFFVYFRSWDLWAGLPANLAAIQILKEYMASEIGVDDGEMIVESKGLHLYGYAEHLAKLRCMKET